MTKRQAHKRSKGATAADADTIATGTAVIMVAAASRVLRTEHGWSDEQATAFGDRLAAVAVQMAREFVAERKGRATAAGDAGPVAFTDPQSGAAGDGPDGRSGAGTGGDAGSGTSG